MLALLTALAATGGADVAQGAPPPLEPGVSRSLASWRAALYRDVRYTLKLDLASDPDSLRGIAEISVVLARPVPDLVLDWRPAQGRSRVSDIRVNGQPLSDPTFAKEHLIIPRGALRAGRNLVQLAFESPVAVSGAAVTRYRDREDGAEYVYTLFVPSDASTAFPCFDQPDLKGRFALELTAPRHWTVIGNTAAEQTSEGERGRLWRFPETLPISTYLFAFAAGEFAQLGEPGHPSRLFVRKSQLARARAEAPEVLRLNREAVRWLENYFDTPFPFPKYDLVLVPEFAYGGMEHAGATFLREESVLFPSVPNETDHLRRAQLVFHEAIHQWFGNLVTMRWFDDLWLKEGFANFLAAKATEALLPQFHAWNAFHALKVAAYRTDVTRGTTPIYQALPNLSAAKSAYGNIVYSKAPGILRQAEFFVGEGAFRSAVRRLVRRHAYGAADWGDLVRALESASGRSLVRWAQAWVKRRGMPRVRVEWTLDAGHRVKQALLTQEDVLGEGGLWPTKLRIALVEGGGEIRVFDTILNTKRMRLREMEGRPPPRLVFANHEDYGYGQFLLDRASRDAALARPDQVPGEFLRALVFDSVWESVREAELDPLRYLEFALRLVPGERDPVTLATLLGRINAAFLHYLPEGRRPSIAGRLEQALSDQMRRADTPGRRISFLRAFLDSASTETARERLKRLLSGTEQVTGVPLSSRDRFRIIARLLTLGDGEAESLLAAQAAADPSDDGRRYAYAAGAARRDAAAKWAYFERALGDATVPESWIESALGPMNAIEHETLTRPLLQPALAALPALKRSRKIFFVNNWLAAFLGGQASAEALEAAGRFGHDKELDSDLRLKVLENLDPLERAVRIRSRFAAGS